jgi:pseudouridine kinase
MVMVDGSLTHDALKMVVRLASQYKVPLVADPSSARLASKLCPYLNQLHLVVPNEAEAVVIVGEEFAGHDQDAALELADRLVKMGVRHAVVTMSDFGLAYATDDETGFIPASYREMVDSTGTGDALSAAVMFGMLEGLPAIEAMRLGAAAASLTLQTTETVVNDLSLDMLYDHLIV